MHSLLNRWSRIVFSGASLFLLTAMPVLACKCPLPQTEEELRDTVSQQFASKLIAGVFTGRVESLSDENGEQLARLIPKRWWKGKTPLEEITLETNSQTDCAAKFEVGKEYLVYAMKKAVFSRWETYSCYIHPVESAVEEMDILDSLAAPQ